MSVVQKHKLDRSALDHYGVVVHGGIDVVGTVVVVDDVGNVATVVVVEFGLITPGSMICSPSGG